tara:strand:- start:729 stop:866 length:138 start_codon:yes stop_codon:yes gene_type:complete
MVAELVSPLDHNEIEVTNIQAVAEAEPLVVGVGDAVTVTVLAVTV